MLFDASDLQVVRDVAGHIFVLEAFAVALADDAGGQGPAGVEHQLVDQVILSRQHDGRQGFGVHGELADGMEPAKISRTAARSMPVSWPGSWFGHPCRSCDRFV